MTRQELFKAISDMVKDHAWRPIDGTMDAEDCESLAESIMDILVDYDTSLVEKVTT
jgi:hypothetical protein